MQAWSPAWPLAGHCGACSQSHPNWCLLLHSSFPVLSLLQAGRVHPGMVQTGMSTQADVARGCVCVVHGNASCNLQTALVSGTKISPQRRCEVSTSGNTCASLHSCFNPVTQPLSVLGLNTLYTSTCLSSLHSLPVASTTSPGSNHKFTHRRTGMVSSPVFTLLGWGVK